MITEDYVSFEVAKLLKEKGFNGLCTAYYDCFTTDNFHCGNEPTDFNSIDTKIRSIVAAPTLQMVMKWLREEHKIGVFPSTYGLAVGVNGSVKHVYGTAIINLETYELMTNDIMPMPTYEEATEVAIKYCLENLI